MSPFAPRKQCYFRGAKGNENPLADRPRSCHFKFLAKGAHRENNRTQRCFGRPVDHRDPFAAHGGSCRPAAEGEMAIASAVARGAVRHVHPLGAGQPDGDRRSVGRGPTRIPSARTTARRPSPSTTTSTSGSTRRSSTPGSGSPSPRRPGMKYMVLTAKHCDGFLLWDSKVDDYNIMHTPFQRDVCGELAKAAHEAGNGHRLVFLAHGLARSGLPQRQERRVRRADAGRNLRNC